MKNISKLRLNEGQNRILFASIGCLLAVGLLTAAFFLKADSATGFRSVELGLAELSPMGKSGGYAVPASGGSVQSCTFDLNPNPAAPNQAITANWTAVFQSDHASNSIDSNPLAFLRAQAQSTDPDGDDNGSNPLPNQQPVRTIRIWRCNTGTNCIPGQSQGWTQIVDQQIPFGTTSGTLSMGNASPSAGQYNYHMRVYYQHGAGGMAQGSFESSETYCADDLTVTNEQVPPPPGTVDLEVARIGTNDWQPSLIINETEQVKLRWSSTNASSCVALSPTHNFVANATAGEDPTVDEPPVGTSYQYQVSCSNSAGGLVGTDLVFVETFGGWIPNRPPTIDTVNPYVPRGRSTTINWNTNGSDPAACVISGPGMNLSPVPTGSGSQTPLIYSESTYTIECPGGSDSVTVHVLPVIQET